VHNLPSLSSKSSVFTETSFSIDFSVSWPLCILYSAGLGLALLQRLFGSPSSIGLGSVFFSVLHLCIGQLTVVLYVSQFLFSLFQGFSFSMGNPQNLVHILNPDLLFVDGPAA
jgi:ABC-type Mn2+/Zn2+ transport system permease subunit